MDVPSLSGAISLSQLYPHLAGDDRAAAAGATEGRSPRLANNNNNQTSVRSRAFRQCTFPERLVAQFLRLNKKKHPRASVQLNRRKCTDAVAIIITLKYLMREHKSQFKAKFVKWFSRICFHLFLKSHIHYNNFHAFCF